jgi:starvation-inducible DNA-binding protein
MGASHEHDIQYYGASYEICGAPDQDVCMARICELNRLLTQTITLCEMYRKHHWQASGPGFYPLHLLFDMHFAGQLKLVPLVAARVKSLGRKVAAPARNFAENTPFRRAPNDREDPDAEISRLLQAHEIILAGARTMVQEGTFRGDDDTRNMIDTDVIHTNNIQTMCLHIYLDQDTL